MLEKALGTSQCMCGRVGVWSRWEGGSELGGQGLLRSFELSPVEGQCFVLVFNWIKKKKKE